MGSTLTACRLLQRPMVAAAYCSEADHRLPLRDDAERATDETAIAVLVGEVVAEVS